MKPGEAETGSSRFEIHTNSNREELPQYAPENYKNETGIKFKPGSREIQAAPVHRETGRYSKPGNWEKSTNREAGRSLEPGILRNKPSVLEQNCRWGAFPPGFSFLRVSICSGFQLSLWRPQKLIFSGFQWKHQTGKPGEKSNREPGLVTGTGFDSIDHIYIYIYIYACHAYW